MAKPGDQVALLPGGYGAQSLGSDPSKTAPAVVIEPVPGAAVRLDSLEVDGASYVTFRNLNVEWWSVQNEDPASLGSHDVTLQNITAHSAFIVGRVARISVRGGSVGDVTNADGLQIKKNLTFSDPPGSEPRDVLVDGLRVGNIRNTDPASHTDGIQIIDGNGITVRNSVFWNVDGTGELDITPVSVVSNVTFENNVLAGGGTPGYSSQIGGSVRNLVVRYNSAVGSVAFNGTDVVGPYTFVGNYMPWNFSLCESSDERRARSTFSHNVLAGGTCDPTDVRVAHLDFVDPARQNLHLVPGANAIGKGDPANAPALDIDGDRRPARLAPDAGADQHETALIVPARSVGALRLGATEPQAVQLHGKPVRMRAIKMNASTMRESRYRVEGGALWAVSDRSSIVGIRTTSPYYATETGIGVGAPASSVSSWTRTDDSVCRGWFRRPYGTAFAFARLPASGRGKIVSFAIQRRRYGDCPVGEGRVRR